MNTPHLSESAALLNKAVGSTLAAILTNCGISSVTEAPLNLERINSETFWIFEMRYSGLIESKNYLICSESFAKRVTESFVGESEELDRSDFLATAGEILNMLTGNLLVAFYGDDVGFDLGLPKQREFVPGELDEFPGQLFSYSSDGDPIIFGVVVSK